MEKDQLASVKDAVHKLQLSMVEGIKNEDQLFAAVSLISRADYQAVVTERSITNICGYPLCSNALPSEPPRKGRYRISLKEHKVYDLHETYMYCSPGCLINSRVVSGSLQDERCPDLNSEKLNRVLKIFGDLSLGPDEDFGMKEGLSDLKIQEKVEAGSGEVSLDQWLGPSNAIEGYVPQQRDRHKNPFPKKSAKEGSKGRYSKLTGKKDLFFNEMDFMSAIIPQGEYTISKMPSGQTEKSSDAELNEPIGKVNGQDSGDQFLLKESLPSLKNDLDKKSEESQRDDSKLSRKDDCNNQASSTTFKSNIKSSTSEAVKIQNAKEVGELCELKLMTSVDPSGGKKDEQSNALLEKMSDSMKNQSENNGGGEAKSDVLGNGYVCTNHVSSTTVSNEHTYNIEGVNAEEESNLKGATNIHESKPKSSLKPFGKKKPGRSITWADEKSDSSGSKNLCEVREMRNIRHSEAVGGTYGSDGDEMLHISSAEACVFALNQVAKAVASGESDVANALSEAGITILPRPHNVDEGSIVEDDDSLEPEPTPLKWPKKAVVSHSDLFDSEDSLFDVPPEGFSLTLSTFATMWNALFEWITSSSLACIYGRNESFQEEYLSVNGREYPQKVVVPDGRSSEIKQALAGCLARALPGLVADLRLPTPISTLEQGLAQLLDTMSFVDALPAFRMKHWKVIVLLFLDSLSVCRIPALLPYTTDRRMLFCKVLDGAQVSLEEYEVMKDLVLPLGRTPQFSPLMGA